MKIQNEKPIVEIKIRHTNDFSKWEIIPISLTMDISRLLKLTDRIETTIANSVCIAFFSALPDAVEARWNWKNNEQGHYVSKEDIII